MAYSCRKRRNEGKHFIYYIFLRKYFQAKKEGRRSMRDTIKTRENLWSLQILYQANMIYFNHSSMNLLEINKKLMKNNEKLMK